MFDSNGNFIGIDPSNLTGADVTTFNVSAPDPLLQTDNSLLAANPGNPAAAQFSSAGAIPNSNVAPGVINTSSPTTSTASWLNPLSTIIGNVGNAVSSIFGSQQPAAGYYNAAGQFVPITGSTKPVASATSVGKLSTAVSSSLSSLMPLLLIGGVIWFVATIAKKK